MVKRLILGSASPRRKALLAQLGIVPDKIVSPDVDETALSGELPRDYCRRIAVAKAKKLDLEDDEAILSADTTVAVGRRILGKPESEDEAAAFLNLMSGRRHRVITAVAVRTRDQLLLRDNVTAVRMKKLTTTEIERYIASDDWRGKAGGYAIQGPAAAFIPWIQGSYSGVMGLPLAETAVLLSAVGVFGCR